MIAWAPIKAEIKSVIGTLAGLPPEQVRWRDEAQGGTWGNQPIILLRLGTVADAGYSEERRTQPTSTDDAIVELVQQKRFTLSVRCESFDQAVDSPKHAAAILGTINTRLRRVSSVMRRSSLFSIWTYGAAMPTPYVADGRQIACHTLDLVCSTVDSDTDTTAGAGGWIGDALINGTVDAVPVSLDVDARSP